MKTNSKLQSRTQNQTRPRSTSFRIVTKKRHGPREEVPLKPSSGLIMSNNRHRRLGHGFRPPKNSWKMPNFPVERTRTQWNILHTTGLKDSRDCGMTDQRRLREPGNRPLATHSSSVRAALVPRLPAKMTKKKGKQGRTNRNKPAKAKLGGTSSTNSHSYPWACGCTIIHPQIIKKAQNPSSHSAGSLFPIPFMPYAIQTIKTCPFPAFSEDF